MSNRLGRYKALYEAMQRPNTAATFPRHVFVRAANSNGNKYDRKGDRADCFESTFVHLTERFNGKEIYLVGTSNSSTMLAQRTQKLISEVKPEAVLVQTNEKWWDTAKMLEYVDSQEEFNHYHKHLDRYTAVQSFNLWKQNTRSLMFWTRFQIYSGLFQFHFKLPGNFHYYQPGLEVKYACEEAEKAGARLGFLGPEFNQVTWQRLFHETRMNMPHYIFKRLSMWGHTMWSCEGWETRIRLQNSEPHQFAERCLDQHLINWYIQSMDVFFPKFKSIFIDRRDEDLFRQIDQSKEKKIVVVVNQWHMEGIEHEWAHRYGQLPRSVIFTEGINPIGDMDLKNGLFQRLYNALHREVASAQINGTPVTYADWIIGYHREANWQYEHRDM